jgi:hypothetical protein
MTQKYFFLPENRHGYQKTHNRMLILNSLMPALEMLLKKFTLYKPKTLKGAKTKIRRQPTKLAFFDLL